MSGKFALIIGNTEYTDPGLAQLTAPGKDAEDFARVLKDREIGAFDQVNIVLNQSSSASIEAIDEFFNQRMPDDLLVLYFSGHGVRDELGALYLAVKNTIRSRLRSTAIKSDYIREAMDQSRSRRQVLILDCCNSGAFAQGTKAATGVSIGTASAFEGGYGRVILTASDSTQFAWEGDQVIGETDNSLFTHYLVEGLEGKADRDGNGHITVDDLYDYAYEKVRLATPKQTPSKFSTKQQGEIILRQNIRIEDIKPAPLPDDLIAATKSSLPFVREGAVRQLEDLLKGHNRGLARSAREALERIAEEDDSRTISRAAFQALETAKQTEVERLAKLEAERLAEEERQVREQADAERKAEAERIVKAQLETERKAKEEKERLAAQKFEDERLAKLEAERLAEKKRITTEKTKIEHQETQSTENKGIDWKNIPWIALSWIIGGSIGGVISDNYVGIIAWAIAWSIGGLIGGLGISIILRNDYNFSRWQSMLWITLGCAFGGAIGPTINRLVLIDAIGWPLAGAISGTISVLFIAVVLRNEHVRIHGNNMFWIVIAYILGWTIGGAILWQDGVTIGGGIGGIMLVWQIRKGISNYTINKTETEYESGDKAVRLIRYNAWLLLSISILLLLPSFGLSIVGIVGSIGMFLNKKWGRKVSIFFSLFIEAIGFVNAILLIFYLSINSIYSFEIVLLWFISIGSLLSLSIGILLAFRLILLGKIFDDAGGSRYQPPAGVWPIAIPMFFTVLGIVPALGLLNKKTWAVAVSRYYLIFGTIALLISGIVVVPNTRMLSYSLFLSSYTTSSNYWVGAIVIVEIIVIALWCVLAFYYLRKDEVVSWFNSSKNLDSSR